MKPYIKITSDYWALNEHEYLIEFGATFENHERLTPFVFDHWFFDNINGIEDNIKLARTGSFV